MGRSFKKLGVIFSCLLGTLVVVVGFQNCGQDVQFSQALSSQGLQEPLSLTDHSATFQITVNKSTISGWKLDLVWIIDNSGSMSQEAAHVRDNLSSFAQYLRDKLEARTLVISRDGSSGTSVSIPVNDPQFTQINRSVASRNAPDILAGLMGESSYSVSAADKNTFQNFFRSDARKVFVYVTDDNSNMSAAQFETALGNYFPNETVTQFGFISFESRSVSPCMARFGSVYKELAQHSGGEVFNICDYDWYSNFNKLAQSIEKISINNQFNLMSATEILDVKLNGRTLSGANYTFTNGVLTISRSVIDVNLPVSRVDVTFN